jgi:hypothetical protein
MNRYLAIVPAYNEVGAVAATIGEINAAAPDFDVLVIDDGSSDGTDVAAAAAGARVVSLPFNLGIGAAVQCGYLYARAQGYEVAVQVDGDGQHDPSDIPRLLAALTAAPETHLVTGSRFLGRTAALDSDRPAEASGAGHRSTAYRRLGIAVFARVVSLLTRQRVTDPTSGFRMVDRLGIELFARDYPSDYPEVEAIVLAHSYALHTREIAVRMRPRTTGSSKISTSVSVYYLFKVLLAVIVSSLRTHPQTEPDPLSEAAP